MKRLLWMLLLGATTTFGMFAATSLAEARPFRVVRPGVHRHAHVYRAPIRGHLHVRPPVRMYHHRAPYYRYGPRHHDPRFYPRYHSYRPGVGVRTPVGSFWFGR